MMFNLPKRTIVNRGIPKNSFDKYTNSKQKKMFTEFVEKIRWKNKISTKTINLPYSEIEEIQIFHILLKKKNEIESILNIIDKSIPYHIIFVVEYGNEIFISTSQKHSHPTNEVHSIIDWTFRSNWFKKIEKIYLLNLKESIDFIFSNLCNQLAGQKNKNISLNNLIEHEQEIASLNYRINKLKASIKNSKQFNLKVELNIELNEVQEKLIKIQHKL